MTRVWCRAWKQMWNHIFDLLKEKEISRLHKQMFSKTWNQIRNSSSFFYLKSHQELEQLLWQGAGGTVCTFLECLFELLHPYKLDFHSALKQKMCPHSLEVTHGTSGEIDKISLLFILNKAAPPKCLFDGSQSFDLPTSRLDLNVSPGGQTLNGTSYKQWQTQALSNMILSIFFPLSYSLIYSVTEIIAESISLPLEKLSFDGLT